MILFFDEESSFFFKWYLGTHLADGKLMDEETGSVTS